jgi:hypothetical protein
MLQVVGDQVQKFLEEMSIRWAVRLCVVWDESCGEMSANRKLVSVPVLSAGAQGQYAGEDQINVGPLPLSLAGSGNVPIVLTANGINANVVNVSFQQSEL